MTQFIPSSHDGLAYFSQFGVHQRLFQIAFDRALCKGGDWADLYFEHPKFERGRLSNLPQIP